ncbi:hypothetical protein EVAR_54469_1 [Eumeta japonica]|uniref:Uncharacterized protein n=1 Tax=Eumeta variegata TaxID=151549 RepID=A0A4C1YWS7_EUMVA|nr:hypothetical protein EVAR_54469_1 [Eumeta japonica]
MQSPRTVGSSPPLAAQRVFDSRHNIRAGSSPSLLGCSILNLEFLLEVGSRQRPPPYGCHLHVDGLSGGHSTKMSDDDDIWRAVYVTFTANNKEQLAIHPIVTPPTIPSA